MPHGDPFLLNTWLFYATLTYTLRHSTLISLISFMRALPSTCEIYSAFLAARVPPTESSSPPPFGYSDPFSLIHRLFLARSHFILLVRVSLFVLVWIAHTILVCAGMLFLQRNPKLMVNYIRPATELGLESTKGLF